MAHWTVGSTLKADDVGMRRDFLGEEQNLGVKRINGELIGVGHGCLDGHHFTAPFANPNLAILALPDEALLGYVAGRDGGP